MTIASPVVPASELYQLRYQSRAWLWSRSKLGRVRNCGRVAVGTTVPLLRYPDGHTVGSSLQHCGSVWACPVCSAQILELRARRLAAIVDEWRARGGQLAMVTLTLSHDRSDSLADLWNDLQDSWTAILATPAWRAAQDRYGVVLDEGTTVALDSGAFVDFLDRSIAESDKPDHVERLQGLKESLKGATYSKPRGKKRIPMCRAIEAVWGPEYGWHVHVHALLFLPGGFDAGSMLGDIWMGDETSRRKGMLERWQFQVEKRGRVAHPLGQEAHIVKPSESGTDTVAKYLAKAVMDGDISKEIIRGDMKLAYGERFTPWQLLALVAGGDHPEKEKLVSALWAEWETVSRGRRQMILSQGFADWLGLESIAEDDSQAMADVDGAAGGWSPALAQGSDIHTGLSDGDTLCQYWRPAGPPEVVASFDAATWKHVVCGQSLETLMSRACDDRCLDLLLAPYVRGVVSDTSPILVYSGASAVYSSRMCASVKA